MVAWQMRVHLPPGGVLMVSLTVNGKAQSIDAAPDMPLLWVLREKLLLTGTKFGCGTAICGSCTVHVDGQPVQQAWMEVDVPQCGYCQSGQIMSAAALLAQKAQPTDADIDDAMTGNICRCGTYPRIRAAIHRA